MLEIFSNPVVVSVVLMCILCPLKLNILVALIISALAVGLTAGMTVNGTISVFMGSMAGNVETAVSYILLDAIAVGIARTDLISILSGWIQKVFEGKRILFLLVIVDISGLSDAIIPVNIAFMPILIPPLIYMMNRTRTSHRVTAYALCWGNRAPYLLIPVGCGLISHNSMSTNMTKYDMPMDTVDMWKAMTLPAGVDMTLGLLFTMFVLYKKPRDCKGIEIAGVVYSEKKEGKVTLNREHIDAIIAALSIFVIQLTFGSLVISRMVGLLIMALSDCFEYSELNDAINSGIGMIGWISFITLAASGFPEVIVASQGIDKLVLASTDALSVSKAMSSIVLILIGFAIVMGAGACFGTVPTPAATYVPMCLILDYSALGAAYLIDVVASVDDVCSLTSDGTLGPASGLNLGGQHDHIWDSTIPTVLVFSLPLFVVGVITSVVL